MYPKHVTRPFGDVFFCLLSMLVLTPVALGFPESTSGTLFGGKSEETEVSRFAKLACFSMIAALSICFQRILLRIAQP